MHLYLGLDRATARLRVLSEVCIIVSLDSFNFFTPDANELVVGEAPRLDQLQSCSNTTVVLKV